MPGKGYRDADIVLGSYDRDKDEVAKGAEELLCRWHLYEESVSKRCDKNIVAITSSDGARDHIDLDGVLLVDIGGKRVEGRKNPPEDLHLHLGLYGTAAELNVAVHTYSTFASAAACAGKSIPQVTDRLTSALGGEIEVVEYADVNAVAAALKSKRACLLSGHGVLATGKTVSEAVRVADAVEKAAQIFAISTLLSTAGNPRKT
jgi:ribulose-5-phosphate 4-epimerase/fuculose-1-phosphate aldolase